MASLTEKRRELGHFYLETEGRKYAQRHPAAPSHAPCYISDLPWHLNNPTVLDIPSVSAQLQQGCWALLMVTGHRQHSDPLLSMQLLLALKASPPSLHRLQLCHEEVTRLQSPSAGHPQPASPLPHLENMNSDGGGPNSVLLPALRSRHRASGEVWAVLVIRQESEACACAEAGDMEGLRGEDRSKNLELA